jgi:hypothetical protein
LNAITLNAFETSDDSLRPDDPGSSIDPERLALPPLLKGVEKHKDEDWIKLVINRFSPRQLIPLGEIEKTLGMSVFATLRNDYQSTIDAINEGRPVVFDRNSIYGQDVRRLGLDSYGDRGGAEEGGRDPGRLLQPKAAP